MQEKLANHYAIPRQVMFKRVDVFIALLPDVLGNQRVRQPLGSQEVRVHADNQNFFVVRAVENPDLAALRNASVRPPQVVVIEFFRAWSLEGMNIATLRIHAGHNVLYYAVLAGGIHRLKDQQQRPAVLRIQLLLQIAEQTGAVVDDFLAPLLILHAVGVASIKMFQAKLSTL